MIAKAALERDMHGETITLPRQRFVALENAASDLRSMASIGEEMFEKALDHSRGRKDDDGMLVLRFSDEWVRDLLFAAYDIRRRTSELFDQVDGISREAFDAPR